MTKGIENLIDGYRTFKNDYFKQNRGMFEHLVRFGQTPQTLVVACSDSRVDPTIITNSQPGDLFVVRNVANLVPPYQVDNTNDYHGTSAALEFGVCVLNVNHIVVLGHADCGGIASLVEPDIIKKSFFINHWMDLARPTYEKVLEKYPDLPVKDRVNCCSQHSVINSANNLMTFPWVAKRVDNGSLFLHSWYFDLSSGDLQGFNSQLGAFENLY